MKQKMNIFLGILSIILGFVSIGLVVYVLIAYGFTNSYRITTVGELSAISYSLLAVCLVASIVGIFLGVKAKQTTSLGGVGKVFSIIGLVITIIGIILFTVAIILLKNNGYR